MKYETTYYVQQISTAKPDSTSGYHTVKDLGSGDHVSTDQSSAMRTNVRITASKEATAAACPVQQQKTGVPYYMCMFSISVSTRLEIRHPDIVHVYFHSITLLFLANFTISALLFQLQIVTHTCTHVPYNQVKYNICFPWPALGHDQGPTGTIIQFPLHFNTPHLMNTYINM